MPSECHIGHWLVLVVCPWQRRLAETQLMRPQGFLVGDKVSKVTRQVGPWGYTDARKKEGEGRGSS